MVAHLLSHGPPLHLIKRTPKKGTWICVIAIKCYLLLACLSISLRVITQVKIEEIRICHNTCVLGTACFWMRHINICTLLWWLYIGYGPYGFLHCIILLWMIKWFVRIFHQCLYHTHRERLVRHWFLLEMFLVDYVWVYPNRA